MEILYTPLINDSNLFAYYRFNSGALTTDSKGSNTLSVGGGTPTSASGRYGGGVNLDTSSYYTRSTAYTVGGSWSMSAWIKSYSGVLISSLSRGYENYIQVGAAVIAVHSEDGGGGAGYDHQTAYPAGYDSSLWNHLAVTCQSLGSDTIIKVYINGVLLGNETKIGKFPSVWESPFYIGYYHVEGKQAANGNVDDLSFSRKVLTATEVKQIFIDTGFPVAAIL